VLFPAQIEALVAVMLGAGSTFTVYVLVVEALFAVTVHEYVVFVVGETVMLCVVAPPGDQE
jgi:hypothetical protein